MPKPVEYANSKLNEIDGVVAANVSIVPNTIFNPHVHPGGEEIFVIKKYFMMSTIVTQRAHG